MNSCCAPSCCVPDDRGRGGQNSVAIIGGGPVGLAAAVHALDRGLDPIILEAGPSVGTSVRGWGHVRMFSPWRYNIDKAAGAALEATGWTAPDPEAFPSGDELAAAYLEPLAKLPSIASRLRLNAKVTAITRSGVGKVRNAGRDSAPFDIRYETADGEEHCLYVNAVIDASGTWTGHGWAGAGGLPAMGERQAGKRLRYGMPDLLGADRGRYAGRRTMVVGSGDSAKGTLIELGRLASEEPGTTVVWVTRRADLTRAFGGGAADQLPERGALGTQVKQLMETGVISVLKPFAIEKLALQQGALEVTGSDDFGSRTVVVDEMIVATGFRPDLALLREIRLDLDPALECPTTLAPLIDPNVHSCGTVRPHGAAELQQPDAGLFIAGMKSYGRAPTFLLATGYEQVRSITAFLAGDIEASRRVELDLPQTGVCSSSRSLPTDTDHGARPVEREPACCAATEAREPAEVAG